MTIRKTALPLLFVMMFGLACASMSHRNHDGQIERDVRNTISSTMSGKVYNTNVVVNDAVVTLTGTTRSEEDRRAIADAVNKIRGVRSVINNIVVDARP
jgi:osmotically-inducible protein OsmY